MRLLRRGSLALLALSQLFAWGLAFTATESAGGVAADAIGRIATLEATVAAQEGVIHSLTRRLETLQAQVGTLAQLAGSAAVRPSEPMPKEERTEASPFERVLHDAGEASGNTTSSTRIDSSRIDTQSIRVAEVDVTSKLTVRGSPGCAVTVDGDSIRATNVTAHAVNITAGGAAVVGDVLFSDSLFVGGQADFANGIAVRDFTFRDFQQVGLNSPSTLGGSGNVDGLVPANWGTFYLHVKVDTKKQTNTMFSYFLEGYSYGSSSIISSAIAGYTYHLWDCIGQDQAVNFAGGIYELSGYCDPNDGHLVLKMTMDHYIYFMSFSYIGTKHTAASNPPKILGVFHFGGAGNSCGDGTYSCAV